MASDFLTSIMLAFPKRRSTSATSDHSSVKLKDFSFKSFLKKMTKINLRIVAGD